MTERPTEQPNEKRGQIPKKEALVVTTLRIPQKQKAFLDAVAQIDGIQPSDVYRAAFQDFIEKKQAEYAQDGGVKEVLKKKAAEKIEQITVFYRGLEEAIDPSAE